VTRAYDANWFLVFALALAVTTAAACAPGEGDGDVVSLSLSSPDPLDPDVGEEVRLVARAVLDDGSSRDVTAAVECALGADDPPGRLDGTTFVAEQPGTVDIRCDYQSVQGTLGVTVRGFRRTPIAALQRGEITEGTQVEIEAVVFGLDPAGEFTDFWAQDEGGGPYSGLRFRDARELPEGQPAPSPVAVGDRAVVRGIYAEREGRTVVEYTEVSVTGSAVPAVDVVAIADLDPAVYDGCLVGLSSVRVANPAVDNFTWSVTDGADTALVETFLYDAPRAAGDPLERIAGPLWLWTDESGGSFAAIAPRSAADVISLAPPLTVFDIQAGEVAEDSVVSLSDLVVTFVDSFEDPDEPGTTLYDLYVQEAGATAGSSILLRDFRAAPSAVAFGDVIDVTGTFLVSGGRKVIDYTDLTVTGTGVPNVDPFDIATDDLRAFESGLVLLESVRASDPEFSDFTWLAIDDRPGGTATVEIETLFHDVAPATDDRFSAIVGLVLCTESGCAVAPRTSDDVNAL